MTDVTQNPNWEQKVIEKTLMATVQEQRRARRWSIFFKLIFLGLIAFAVIAAFSDHSRPLTVHTAMINVDGVIDTEFNSADSINEALRAAFEEKTAKGIVLKLNSPGGSPVQSNEVYDEILRLRKLYPEKKIYAVMGDTCASGCYYIAAAANEIYASPASLVGSIGVLFDGFGFVDTLDKLGVQRRLHTAGVNKGFMDPFSPESPEMTNYLQTMLDDVHQQFIKAVQQGRGDRLKQNDLLFTGLAWTGNQSLSLGLIDGLGSAQFVARDLIGAEDMIEYSIQPFLLERIFHQMGASIAYGLRSEMYPQMY